MEVWQEGEIRVQAMERLMLQSAHNPPHVRAVPTRVMCHSRYSTDTQFNLPVLSKGWHSFSIREGICPSK